MKSIRDLKPGDEINTLAGPATFLTFREGNFRNQNFKVRMKFSQQERWYSEVQLRAAMIREAVSVSET